MSTISKRLALGLLVAAMQTAVADRVVGPPPPADYYADLAARAKARVAQTIAARAPKLVPPVPIKVNWRVAKVGSFDLGGPLVALTAGELDGDPRSGELYAVTPRDVIAIGFRGGKLVELGRVAFAGEHAVPEPRDVVGTAVIDGNEVVAAVSPWAKELRVHWAVNKTKTTLVGTVGAPGFVVCPGVRAQLSPGRNYFTGGTFDMRCRTDLVDPQGYPLHVKAELATSGKLAVTVEKCPIDQPCVQTGKFEYPRIGIAFAIADVDRDGTPEVIVSEASPPNSTDSAKVITLGGDDKKGVFQKGFQGGVAGLVVVDGDDADDIPEVLAAVRFPTSNRLDIWRLD